jgi:biofilm PGA synthesis N-glycosyltransferase PgaC
MNPPRYIAITPARDEEKLLPDMIQSMASQTIPPSKWIIIDDGSDDSTGQIIDCAARAHPWIEPKHLPPGRKREPGGESVIMHFLSGRGWEGVEYLVRFDADLRFEPDYIERLFAEFRRDPKLGIAGGCLLEPSGGKWQLTIPPLFHVRGATKVYSRACFQAIGGLESGLGWDTIDEVKAMMCGFRTRSFPEIVAVHRRTTGSARGLRRARFGQGRIAHYVGYSQLFTLARALRLLFKTPRILGSAMFLAGFYSGYLRRVPQFPDRELLSFVRRQQLRRLTLRPSLWQ